ncbi:MAG: polysaccharide deacetylase family protein [Planctomycetes bacterium]|nr:polysaccharide deacetylase family protein [Planctomycetota bacterium]
MTDRPRTIHKRAFQVFTSAWTLGAIVLTLVVVAAVGQLAYSYSDELSGPRVVCLMYHRFVTQAEYDALRGEDRFYSIATERFEEHLRWLRDRGYHTLTTEECLAYLRGAFTPPDNSVLITIDDGYLSTLTRAQPLLTKYGMRATLFVTADENARVFSEGRPRQRRLTNEELQALDPSVIDVQAHGFSHRPLREMSDDDLAVELTASRMVLAKATGRAVRCMAVPGNHYDERVLRKAREAGYDAVFTSDAGSLDVGDDPFGLPRVNVAGYFDAAGVAAILDPAGMARRRFIRTMTEGPKQLLGAAIGEPVSRAVSTLFATHPPSARHLYGAMGLLALAWAVPVMARKKRGQRAALRKQAVACEINDRSNEGETIPGHS